MTALAARPRRRVARIVLVAVFLIAFLWELLGAVSNLLAWTGFAASLGRGLTGFAWAVLIVGLLIPPVSAAVGLLLARGSTVRRFALVLGVALCASEALTFSQLAFFQAGVSGS